MITALKIKVWAWESVDTLIFPPPRLMGLYLRLVTELCGKWQYFENLWKMSRYPTFAELSLKYFSNDFIDIFRHNELKRTSANIWFSIVPLNSATRTKHFLIKSLFFISTDKWASSQYDLVSTCLNHELPIFIWNISIMLLSRIHQECINHSNQTSSSCWIMNQIVSTEPVNHRRNLWAMQWTCSQCHLPLNMMSEDYWIHFSCSFAI